MRALQYVEIGKPPQVVEIDKPTPAPGEVLLKVTAAGACHSDEFIMSLPEDQYIYGLPLTLGHEGVGIVEELGEGATGVKVGDAVAVYGPWGCGACKKCQEGHEQYCPHAAELGIAPPGLGSPGSMAEYMIVKSPRHLVPIGDLDPVAAVALTDAGLTPYHAIKSVMPRLSGASWVVTIGAGGLGHMAIQLLKVMTGASVITLDVNEEKLAFAREMGADHTALSDENAPEEIRKITGGAMADVVLDFVGIQPTVETAGKCVHTESEIVIVGVGNGALPVGIFTLPYETVVRAPYWGYRQELAEVVDLARRGKITVETETFPLDEGFKAYERMHEGSLRGRAVVVP
ncbi:NAD(P)-dependent alcohol dehydrogenase [Kocuria soli]|uniref:alcohol dehydrogenase n=1 Tax=Kocuria soli TaxID=2485125 RepID=A0A3N3ZZ75_9MICC|nr:NAD(P)-dependent alcohol dehydrogenase [Kocuria soli]ROZ64290.1 NAD(P)-dependent alcohol dehydrogenase [Kocuria soli]